MQGLSQHIREKHANINVAVKKKIDLINRLVETVESYSTHEKLTQITVSGNNATMGEAIGAYQEANATLTRIQSIASGFPDLKASASYQKLMEDIKQVETLIQERREQYNQVVRLYNSKRVSIPHIFWADKLGFSEAPYFDVETADDLKNMANFTGGDAEALRQLMGATTDRITRTATKGAVLVSESASKLLDQAKTRSDATKTGDTDVETPTKGSAPEES